MKTDLTFAETAERSIMAKYRRKIFTPFVRGINEFKMIEDGDKIAVCLSGGKDSMLLAKCMQELKKHNKINFELKFLVMDPGYDKENLKKIKDNAKKLNVPITVFKSDIFAVVEIFKQNPCYMCARMRRGFLYRKAQELGCNKIALGHHFDDVIETVLISMFYGGEFKTMVPKVNSKNFAGMELIRPLYYVREKSIISWAKSNNLEFIACACKLTKQQAAGQEGKRKEIKRLIEQLREKYFNIDTNILKSTMNVNTDTLLGYRNDDEEHSFLEIYERKRGRNKKREGPV